MWNGWSFKPVINPQQDLSDEESYHSPDEADQFVSPRRPPQSPGASPRALLRPDPPAVEEVLERAGSRLRSLPRVNYAPPNQRQRQQPPPQVPAMPEIVPFETEDGVDEAGALREACARVEKVVWDFSDLAFVFSQLEIKMASSGVKKNFTKFQVLSSCLPQKVITQVKKLLRKNEAEFPEKNAYKLLLFKPCNY